MTDRETRFLQLVREHDARLRRIARLYAPDEDARNDLYQDMLVQLWRALPSFTGASSPGTWLYRVALNTALDAVRREAVRRRARADEQDVLRPQRPARPDERIERAQALERLYAAIVRLQPLDRALVLLLLEERSHREIAEIVGISESNVGVRLHRARKRLSRWLAEMAA